jgi:UDP-N-acetylglucosamine 4-epimerase
MIRDAVGAAGIEPRHAPARAGDVKHSFADISRACRLLGYEPQWSLRDGLAKTVEHFTRSPRRPERS